MERKVTLCVRVWIEINMPIISALVIFVTLCVRVWIEMSDLQRTAHLLSVTLCVRVWIEMIRVSECEEQDYRHPLREGVD